MGFLLYDTAVIEVDDRTLAHIQVVIVSKLRRNESFVMSWRDSPAVGDGHSAIWLQPAIPLYFKYDGSRRPAIDRDWVELLVNAASSPSGLHVIDLDGVEVPVHAVPPWPSEIGRNRHPSEEGPGPSHFSR